MIEMLEEAKDFSIVKNDNYYGRFKKTAIDLSKDPQNVVSFVIQNNYKCHDKNTCDIMSKTGICINPKAPAFEDSYISRKELALCIENMKQKTQSFEKILSNQIKTDRLSD